MNTSSSALDIENEKYRTKCNIVYFDHPSISSKQDQSIIIWWIFSLIKFIPIVLTFRPMQ